MPDQNDILGSSLSINSQPAADALANLQSKQKAQTYTTNSAADFADNDWFVNPDGSPIAPSGASSSPSDRQRQSEFEAGFSSYYAETFPDRAPNEKHYREQRTYYNAAGPAPTTSQMRAADTLEVRFAQKAYEAAQNMPPPFTPVEASYGSDVDRDSDGLGQTVSEPVGQVEADRRRTEEFNDSVAQDAISGQFSDADYRRLGSHSLRLDALHDVAGNYSTRKAGSFTRSEIDRDIATRRLDYLSNNSQDDLLERGRGFATESGLTEMPSTELLSLQQRVAQDADIGSLDFTGPPHESNPFLGHGMQWLAGGAAMSTIQGVAQAYSPYFRGEATIPGQVPMEAAGNLLPGLAGIIGGFAGARVGAPIEGALIGGAIGQGGQSIFDDTIGRGFEIDRAGQSLSVGRGGADAVNEFTDALRNAATPAVRDLADTLTSIGRTGFVAPSAAAGFGQLQYSLGTAFQQTMTDEDSFLGSSPFFGKQRVAFGTDPLNGLSTDDYIGLAGAAAAEGDYAGVKSNLGLADARGNNVRPYNSPLWALTKSVFAGGDLTSEAESKWDAWDQDRKSHSPVTNLWSYIAGGAVITPNAADQTKITDATAKIDTAFYGLQGAQATDIDAQSQLGASMTELQTRILQGGGSTAFASMRPQVIGEADTATTALSATISHLRSLEKLPGAPDVYLESQIADARAKRDQIALTTGAQYNRAAFEATEAEAQGRFESSQGGYSLALTREKYAGESYAQMRPEEDRLLSSETAQAAHYRALSVSPVDDLNRPQNQAERSQALATAEGIESQVAQQRYGITLATYAQTLGEGDVRIGQGQTALNRAQLVGNASDVSGAYDVEISHYREQIAELNKELADGSLTLDDRIDKEKQLSSVQQSLDTATYKQQIDTTERKLTVSGYEAGTAASRYGMDIAQSGSGEASIGDLRSQISSLLNQANTAQAQADTSTSDVDKAKYGSQAADFRGQALRAQIELGSRTLDPGREAQEISTTGELRRLGSTFLEPGNIQDVRTDALAQVTQDLRTFEQYVRTAYPSGVSPAAQPQIAQERQDLLDRQADIATAADRSFFDKLPAMSIGGPSFEARYLPTASQTASELERMGYGSLAVRNFGSYDPHSFESMITTPGAEWLTADKSWADVAPGNRSLMALGGVRNPAAFSLLQNPHGPNSLMPLPPVPSPTGGLTEESIARAVRNGMNGATITLDIKYPDGSRQRAAAPVVAVQKGSETSGMGSHIPGISR